jgi:hypothetical protein
MVAGSDRADGPEFFVPMETLAEENSQDNPALRDLIARTSVSANFLNPGEGALVRPRKNVLTGEEIETYRHCPSGSRRMFV